MKLTKQTLIAAAVTGILAPAAQAQFGVNLVQNPSFEGVTGTAANLWAGNVSTYAYALGYTGPQIPGSGERYWFGGGGTPSASQGFSVAAAAPQIDAGQVSYSLQAFFSTYLNQTDYGTVQAIFLDAGNASLGSSGVIGSEALVLGLPAGAGGVRDWASDTTSGMVPAGTRTIQVSLLGTKQPGVGAVCDGYIDLLDLQLQVVPEPASAAVVALGGLMFVLARRRR
jgi:hypothetical protein